MTYRFSPEPLVETSYFERPGALGSPAELRQKLASVR